MIVLIAATSACGADSGPVTTDAPTPFSASSTSTPEGFTTAECPGAIGGKRVILRLDVPKEFEPESTGPTDTFGDLEGERLSWWSYSDGTPFDCVHVQANGIRVFWQNPDDIDQRLDDLEAVLDSIELIRS